MISSTIKNSKNEEVPIDPLAIFQRISLNIFEPDDLKKFLRYELAPFPLSLFTEGGLRKTKKATFYDEIEILSQEPISTEKVHIVDGGYFLHKIVWNKLETVEDIISKYVCSAKKHYAKNSTFVFDGYPEDTSTSTKSVERFRRKQSNVGNAINIDISNKSTKVSILKKEFMKNDNNKKQLINLLKPALESCGFLVKIAEEDADALIVSTALQHAIRNSTVDTYIVGQDVDLIVILTQYVDLYKSYKLNCDIGKLYFVKETIDGAGRHKREIFDADSFKHKELKGFVGFCHIFTGCDTTSAFHFQGKNKIFRSMSCDELKNCIIPFYEAKIDRDMLDNNSFTIVANMYSTQTDKKQIKKMGKTDLKLHDLRYVQFTRQSLKSKCKLENLPPTEGALRQHAYRTYFQLQSWLKHFNLTFSIENDTFINPIDWGWKISKRELMPVKSLDPLVPDFLLKKITCSCKTGCARLTCGCKKLGLHCSNLCTECTEDVCENWDVIEDVGENFNDASEENLNNIDIDFDIEEINMPPNKKIRIE